MFKGVMTHTSAERTRQENLPGICILSSYWLKPSLKSVVALSDKEFDSESIVAYRFYFSIAAWDDAN